MPSYPINTRGYIEISGDKWGDIIIIKRELFEKILNEREAEARLELIEGQREPVASEPAATSPGDLVSRLRDIMENYEVTQSELASLVGTKQPTISKLLSKKVSEEDKPKDIVRDKIERCIADEANFKLRLDKYRKENPNSSNSKKIAPTH